MMDLLVVRLMVLLGEFRVLILGVRKVFIFQGFPESHNLSVLLPDQILQSVVFLHDGHSLFTNLLRGQREGLPPLPVSGILARVTRPSSVLFHSASAILLHVLDVDIPPVLFLSTFGAYILWSCSVVVVVVAVKVCLVDATNPNTALNRAEEKALPFHWLGSLQF